MDRGEFQIEICAGGVESCQAALQGGADRVELCAALPEGGITPSYGEIKVAREVLDDKAAMHVMIRPRGGDFVYSRLELDRMAVDIDVCRLLGADGVDNTEATIPDGADLSVYNDVMFVNHYATELAASDEVKKAYLGG